MQTNTKQKTHTGVVVRNTGNHVVKLRMTATAWVASKNEFYYRDTGQRCGSHGRGKLLLDTIVLIPSDSEVQK